MLQLHEPHTRAQALRPATVMYENAHEGVSEQGGGPDDMRDPSRVVHTIRLRHSILSWAIVATTLLATLALAAPAQAATVVYRFQALIQGGDNADGLLDPVGGLNVGNTINGFFAVDDTVLDSDGSPNFGSYQAAVIALQVDLGSLDFVFAPHTATTNNLVFLNDFGIGPVPTDGYATDVLDGGANFGATVFDTANFHFTLASSDTSLTGVDLIANPQPTVQAGAFDRLNEFSISGTAGVDSFMITGVITQVPEPGTGVLLALGLTGLAARRRGDRAA